MKKNPNASQLAARLSAAASQPAGTGTVPIPVLISSAPVAKTQAAETDSTVASTRTQTKKAKTKEPDTIPITLRPSSALLSKYVLKAAERTREEGRVVSAQQIMIEALEKGTL